MRTSIFTILALLLLTNIVPAQDKTKDSCIVGISSIIHDEEGELTTTRIKEFGRFEVLESSEEDRFTHAFRLPNTRLFVVASIYYTDESMASEKTYDSVSLELMISRSKKRDILSNIHFADAELPNNPFDVGRVQMIVRVRNRSQIVTMECKRIKQN